MHARACALRFALGYWQFGRWILRYWAVRLVLSALKGICCDGFCAIGRWAWCYFALNGGIDGALLRYFAMLLVRYC